MPGMLGERTVIHQHQERAVPDKAGEFLELGVVAHVGFCLDGQPYVIPMSYQYSQNLPDKLYLHGGRPSRLLRTLSGGVPVCVTVSIIDGLVYSRTALNHSMNYRSVVVLGYGREVTSLEEKASLLETMIARYFPQRTVGVDYKAPSPAQLEATLVAEIAIEEMSAKARSGGPTGPNDADDTALGTCGVLEWFDGLRPVPGA